MAIVFRCQTCGAVPWQGGTLTADGEEYVDLPVGEFIIPDGSTITVTAQDIWSGFADTACPLNGVGCPNTTAAVLERAQRQPATTASVHEVQAILTIAEQRIVEVRAIADAIKPIADAAPADHQSFRDADAALAAQLATLTVRVNALPTATPALRIGTVTSTTKATAVVSVDGKTVSALRTSDSVKSGDTVAVQSTGTQWVVLAVIAT